MSFANSDFELPVASYPTTEHILEDGNSKIKEIYPCFLRLSKTAILSLPPTTHNDSPKVGKVPGFLETRTVESVSPQSSDNEDSPSMLSPSDGKTSHKAAPPRLEIDTDTPQEDSISPSSSLGTYSSSPSIGSPIYVEMRTLRANVLPIDGPSLRSDINRSSLSHSSSPQTLQSFNDSVPSLYHSSRASSVGLPFFGPPISLRLFIRPSSHITRRYSDRFDSRTVGLNGSSRAQNSRPALHSDGVRYLDLAGFAEDNAAVVGGPRGYPFVDIELTLNDDDGYGAGTSPSVLWGGEIYDLL